MASFPYDPNNSDHTALVDNVAYHADMVLANKQTGVYDDAQVYANAVQAMRHVLGQAPRDQVTTEASSASPAIATPKNYAEVEAPSDYLRFLELWLEAWNAPLDRLDDPTSARVQNQYHDVTTMDTYHPVGCLVTLDGTQQIRCWPQDGTIDVFEYVPEKAPELVGERLREAIHLRAAGAVLQSKREEGAQTLKQAANIYLAAIAENERLTTEQAIAQAEEE